jgi:putative alpha-1,2-mannosidase
MSAWLVFSMAGLYPVCPGTTDYVLGSPALNRVTIRSGTRPFVIEARNNAPQNVYIQSATLNGKPFTQPTLDHATIQRGGSLVLTMGKSPNSNWGSGK